MKVSLVLHAWLHAARAIRADLGRSAGVVLGVAVATSALTLLSAISASGQRAIVSATGGGQNATLMEVSPAALAVGARGSANPRPLDTADADLVRGARSLRSARVAARRQITGLAVWQGEAQVVRVLGVSLNLPRLLGLRPAHGRLLAASDARAGRRTVLLGKKVAEQLPGDDPIQPGDRLRIDGVAFQVIGILEAAPSFSSGNPWDWDGSVLMTDAAFLTNFGTAEPQAVDRIFVGLGESVEPHLRRVRDTVRNLMSFRHGGPAGVHLDGGEDRKRRLELVLQVVSALLLITAAISLLVSSLNVMNATLISTTERCYEIGLRRSLGASRWDVFWQFVIEAAVLSATGAAAGLVVGLLLLLASHPLVRLAMPDWRLTIVAWGPAAAVLLPVLVSGLFTLYPAWRGASLDPVTALRRR